LALLRSDDGRVREAAELTTETHSAAPGRGAMLLAGAAALAALIAFVVGVKLHAFRGDDCFISFRYARHLADGLGPVWNPGERVEGYTNFSWVVLMALGMRLGLEPELWSSVLGIASGVLLLARVLTFSARAGSPRDPWAWFTVLVLCLSGSFTAWCTGGLETMFFALLVFLGYAALADRPTQPRAAALALAAAALTRPEGLLFAGIASAVMLLDLLRERDRRRSGLGALLLLWGLVAIHLLWRRSYYGYWVPNTFYAKVPGPSWAGGLEYSLRFHEQYRLGWFLPLALLALWGERRRAALLAFAFLGPYLGYVVAVGGDQFEFRFVVHVLPWLYWLPVEGARTLWEGARLPVPRAARMFLAAASVVLLILTTQQGFGRHGREHSPTEGIDYYASYRSEEGRFLRRLIESGQLPRDVPIAVTGAGAVPYYTGWTTIDILGLNDEYVAHLPLTRRGRLGHERRAPYEYLVQRGVVLVDVYNQLLHDELPPRRPYPEHMLRLKYVPLESRFLVFGTFASDEDLARALPGLEIRELPG
jgi:hypothetical protein